MRYTFLDLSPYKCSCQVASSACLRLTASLSSSLNMVRQPLLCRTFCSVAHLVLVHTDHSLPMLLSRQPMTIILSSGSGLEYPAFYTRLYNLIIAEAFAAKHRAQFFKLADLFLSSGLVPAYTAAAFAKKMARLAVAAPPAGAMTAIAFIHNLIRRHPACTVLLDNPAGASKAGPGVDVYDETQEDPAKSRAVESSLWELSCLRNHYCPQVGGERARRSVQGRSPLLLPHTQCPCTTPAGCCSVCRA